jgi:UDP-N-acetylmuramoyl-tripeptide--D-alanyl-D-alanine ligase
MSALWTERELTEAVGVPPSMPLNRDVDGVSIDSRTLRPGDLFLAIKGETHDGHDHVGRALAAGAAAAIVAKSKAGVLAALGAMFAVDDTLKAAERLGLVARARSHAKIVAVTGSVGKTTAKEMLRVMLTECGTTHASAASYNNHWGVPLTLARMPASAAFGVFEIGMNHAGEIAPLVRMVRPDAALITTIAPVHIEHLGSIEAIADAKAEIFEGLTPGGTAILNRDAPQFARLANAAGSRATRVLSFGSTPDCDARLTEVTETGRGSRVRALLLGKEMRFELGAPGKHMAENALGALLAASALGADIDACAAALKTFAPQKGRGERLSFATPDGAVTIIDESYNANPASMRAALALLGAAKPGPNGRRIAVVGDMLELGTSAAAMHAELAADLIANRVDLLFGAGPLTRALFDAAPSGMGAVWASRAADLTPELASALRAGDVVMIKGSNGSRMGPLVKALSDHFASMRAKGEGVPC